MKARTRRAVARLIADGFPAGALVRVTLAVPSVTTTRSFCARLRLLFLPVPIRSKNSREFCACSCVVNLLTSKPTRIYDSRNGKFHQREI